MDRADSRTTYEALSVFQKPLCLIENGPDGVLKACDEVLDELKVIRSPLNIISITGLYRTGKSYLLNYLAGKRKGFPLGSSIRSKTKGIWAWCRIHPKRNDEVLLLLDTEGLGDPMKSNEENDCWIFALSVILSSTLVYNSMKTIGQDGLSKLHYVTELTKRMKTRSTLENEEGREFFKFFPNFVWVVRDFTLDLEVEGKPVTANEYLLDTLKLKEGTTANIVEYNRPRECIRQFFEDKKCFVFPRPVDSDKLMKELEVLPDSQLQDAFLHEADDFCRYIHTQSFPKTAEGQPINGKMLCHLLETYLDVIHSGKILCVENAVKNMAERENSEAVKDSLNLYKDEMIELLQKSVNTEEELSKAHLDCSRKALECFMSMSTMDEKQKYQSQLVEMIRQKYKEICSEWERDHGGTECENGGPEKEKKRLLIEQESLQLQVSKLKDKLIKEKKNHIEEQTRRLHQRDEECESLPARTRILLQQQQEMKQIIEQQNKELEAMKRKDDLAFKKFLMVTASTLAGAFEGALIASELSLPTVNPLIVGATIAAGAVTGGVGGLAAGLGATSNPALHFIKTLSDRNA